MCTLCCLIVYSSNKIIAIWLLHAIGNGATANLRFQLFSADIVSSKLFNSTFCYKTEFKWSKIVFKKQLKILSTLWNKILSFEFRFWERAKYTTTRATGKFVLFWTPSNNVVPISTLKPVCNNNIRLKKDTLYPQSTQNKNWTNMGNTLKKRLRF